SSFTYKRRPVDVKQAGRELGVRYVLEGSVRKAANRVRITAQLIDAISGNHLWADRIDGVFDDIFELQDQVTQNVGGNVTGFALYEFGMSAKWLELLKRIAPNVTRVGVLRDAALTSGVAYFAAIQSVAPSLGIEVNSIGVREGSEIERAVTAFAGSSNRGLIMTPTPYTAPVRNLIIALAARHKLPTVYYQRFLVAAGGLASYGPNL